jgi:type I restriction enzyme S subunit
MAEFPIGWDRVSLGDAADWLSGGTPKTDNPEYWGGEIPWITSGSLVEWNLKRSDRTLTELGLNSGSRLVPAGTTLFVVRGMSLKTEFRIGIAKTPVAFGQDLKALRAKEGIEAGFLAYAIKAQTETILELVDEAGHGTGRLNTDQLKALTIPLPPLSEQRSITELLGGLDNKIESNRRLMGILEKLVEAEYRRSTCNAELTPMDFWVRVEMGSAFKGAFFSEPPVGRPLIRIRDLRMFTPKVWTTEDRPDEIVIRSGDIVVGMDAEFRSTVWLGAEGVLNQRMCRFTPGAGVSNAFALHAIRDDLEFCERAKSGTTVIHLNKSDIDRFMVPKLTLEEHAELAEKTDSLMKGLIAASLESRTLESLRDALLPELLSGRLRTPAAAELVEVS